MPTVAVIAFLALSVNSAELFLAKHDGIPGRRIGGGTRHEIPKPRIILS